MKSPIWAVIALALIGARAQAEPKQAVLPIATTPAQDEDAADAVESWDVTSAPLVVDEAAPVNQAGEAPGTAPGAGDAAEVTDSTDSGPASGNPVPESGGLPGQSLTDESRGTDEDLAHQFSANYFAILYGPSVQQPGEFQPSPYGDRDPSRPVELKNFAGLSYNFTKEVALTPTAYWSWYAGQQQFTMNDPFVRLSRTNVIDTKLFNLYSDLRVHVPASQESQSDHLITGLQTFQSLSFQVSDTPLALGLYGSARVNFFGDQGLGNDLELYVGPNLFFQIAHHASLTLLYEEQLNHQYGAKAFHFWTPGSDLEPGVAWDITPNLMVNPYLNLNTGGQVALSTTSFGMMMNWRMF